MFDLLTKTHPCNPDWNHVASCGGYLSIKCPSHPSAWKNGYIYLHRIVMEMKLGRFLTDAEVVHHKDENGRNDDPENLELKVSQSAHARSHMEGRGHPPLSFVCAECHTVFSRAYAQRPSVKGAVMAFCSRWCNGRFQRRKQLSVPVDQLDRSHDS